MKENIFPIRVVEEQGVKNSRALLVRRSLQIGLAERDTAQAEPGGHLILDFGREMCGGVRLLVFRSDGGTVRVRFGESLTECCSELGGRQNATNCHALRDLTLELPYLSDTPVGDTGFRFVRLDFSGRAELRCVVAESRIRRKKAQFTYSGDDSLIRRIFDTAKRTVDLCAAGDFVWDGVKRDRLVWVGDMHPEMLALTTLYGRDRALERSLDYVKEETPLPGWMNGYPMYSMWWVIILGDYREVEGTAPFIKRQTDYLEGLVRQMLECVEETGELGYPSYFVDWPTHGTSDELHGVRAINIIAARRAIVLLEEAGRDSTSARILLERLLRIPITPERSKQVTALKHFAVGLTEEDRERLTEGGAKGMSTFMSYYILKAVASFDRDRAVEMMREYYGAMLSLGATTFWEDFDMEWTEGASGIDRFPREGERDIHGDFGTHCYIGFRHSLCHGWSAGVIRFIAEECR